jgi:DNA-binding MarR family transcriptional regulator
MPGDPPPDFTKLLEFRVGLRRFLAWSEQLALSAGLTPMQHQLLLAIRGHPDPRGPTIGEAAGYLLLRHHSVVGLVNRAVAAGLVRRVKDPSDQRVVRLRLTSLGSRRITQLTKLTIAELGRLPGLQALWGDTAGSPAPRRR